MLLRGEVQLGLPSQGVRGQPVRPPAQRLKLGHHH
jgi:hypothetical protein